MHVPEAGDDKLALAVHDLRVSGRSAILVLAIVLPRIVTVLFGTIRPSTTSTTFTRIIARACV
jgi:fucose permease